MYKIKAVSVAALALLLLNACTMVGPDYKKPETQVDDQWMNANGSSGNHGANTSKTQDAAWWKSFNDPVLNNLIEEGYKNNLSLQSTGMKVLQARALLAQSVGELYPQQQSLSADYTRQSMGSGGVDSDTRSSTFDIASTKLQASWEPDFWGKYRRAIRADDASFLSSLADYDNALVSLTAEIGTSYVAIRMYQAQISVTEKNIAVQKENLNLVQNRYQLGQVSQSDVEQAITALSQTEASLPPIKTDLQQEKDALAVLLGTTPNKVDDLLLPKKANTKSNKIPVAPSSVAVGIPKDILRQRPDVRQAELEAIAQSEGIGAVKAQLYPAFSLTGSFGYSASNMDDSSTNDIFQWSNRTYSIGPSLSLPLLNYGQITNQVRQQDAVFQQAIFNYQNVVLNAQKEVQDGIVSYIEAQKTLKSMTAANTAALKTTQLTLIRYQEGEVDYSDVLNAEVDQLNVQLSLINAQGSVPQDIISLYRALGGGWQIRQGHDVVSDDVKKQMSDRTNWGDMLNANSDADKPPSSVLPSW